MNRLRYEIKKESDGGFGYHVRGHFYKDGEEFAIISADLISDLRAIFKGSEDDILEELRIALRYEMRDASLNSDLDKLLKEIFIDGDGIKCD